MNIVLYHGATEPIKQPIVNIGRSNLDFGPAFYLTRLRTQAQTWAYRTMVRRNASQQWINIYEFDMELALTNGARYQRFETYNDQWLDFVVGNRQGLNLWQQYDIVEGGVANDRVINTVELYTGGLLSREEALGRLMYEEPNNQIALLNQSVVDSYLRHTSCEQLNEISTIIDTQKKGGSVC